MLKITDLHVSVGDKKILKGINLTINQGEVHAIMGPNGSGKSTLSNIITGRDGYTVTQGSIVFQNENLLEKAVDERAHAGILMSFQYPIEIPGVSMANFLKAAINTQRKLRGEDEIDAMDLLTLLKENMKFLEMSEDFLYRGVNEGFSGGEKKRNEILQLLSLQPTLAILDETDSGLDIDALQIVAKGINALRDPTRSIIVITHYQRLLDHVAPDFVHVLKAGTILKSGDKTLALELESQGYGEASE